MGINWGPMDSCGSVMKNKEKSLVITSFIFGAIAILIASVSAILLFVKSESSAAFGVISTIMSILLSIAAMLYTYISGKDTLQLLEKIESQNKKLVDKINLELLKDAYDENGLRDAQTSRLASKPNELPF